MKLLAGTHYDPSTAASISAASLQAMTAIDTTNLRLTFTAPSNGSVMVRMRGVFTGATTSSTVLFGVLDGATVKARQAGICGNLAGNANADALLVSSMVITGLTPGQSYTWDAAFGVEFAVASCALKYGGPNNTTSGDAWGGFAYEIYDAQGLLASAAYDPAVAVTKSVASLLAMTAIDTTNLRCTFVAPSRGIVVARIRGVVSGTTSTAGNALYGVLDGATVRARNRGVGGATGVSTTILATEHWTNEATMVISGLTGGTTYNLDAAYDVENTIATGSIKYGGPDNATQDDAWGQFTFDVWNADDLPRQIGSVA